MPITTAFLNACRALVLRHTEYTEFVAAHAAFAAAARADRPVLWQAAYGNGQVGQSPAYRLRKVIRDVVTAQVDAGVNRNDREGAYQTLAAELVAAVKPPKNALDEQAELQAALIEDQAS